MHIFNKYASHACMIEHIFKYVYGEKPSWAKEKPRRGDFANAALNSYNIFNIFNEKLNGDGKTLILYEVLKVYIFNLI